METAGRIQPPSRSGVAPCSFAAVKATDFESGKRE